MEKVTLMLLLVSPHSYLNAPSAGVWNLRLVTKFPGQNNLLMSRGILNLKRSILKVLLDTDWDLAVLLHLLLHRELAIKLGNKLIINLSSGSLVHAGGGEGGGGLGADWCGP